MCILQNSSLPKRLTICRSSVMLLQGYPFCLLQDFILFPSQSFLVFSYTLVLCQCMACRWWTDSWCSSCRLNIIPMFPTFERYIVYLGYSQKYWVGVCGLIAKTITLFKIKICDFSYPIYDLTKYTQIWHSIKTWHLNQYVVSGLPYGAVFNWVS